jgi:thioredoxin reductase (NADPH)
VTTRIRVYGTDWCHSTFGVREYLMNARLEYDFFDIDRDPRADDFVRALGEGRRRYPVVVFPDEIVTNPTVSELGQLLRDHGAEPAAVRYNTRRIPRGGSRAEEDR